MFGHDLQHTQESMHSGPASPRKKWASTTGDLLGSSAATGRDGAVYVGSDDKKLHAIGAGK